MLIVSSQLAAAIHLLSVLVAGKYQFQNWQFDIKKKPKRIKIRTNRKGEAINVHWEICLFSAALCSVVISYPRPQFLWEATSGQSTPLTERVLSIWRLWGLLKRSFRLVLTTCVCLLLLYYVVRAVNLIVEWKKNKGRRRRSIVCLSPLNGAGWIPFFLRRPFLVLSINRMFYSYLLLSS